MGSVSVPLQTGDSSSHRYSSARYSTGAGLQAALCCSQEMNARQGQHLGAAIHVPMKLPVRAAALKHTLGPALQRILADPSYQERAGHISALMRARRWTPAEQAADVRSLP